MQQLLYPIPNPLNGEGLREQLANAGIVADVCVIADELVIATDATNTAVAPVVAAHRGEAPKGPIPT